MLGRATVLVIKIGAYDPIDSLFGALDDDDEIILASPQPVGFDEGARLVRTRNDIGVVLIIAREAAIPAAEAAIWSANREVNIVAVAIDPDTGKAILSLRDPVFRELVRVVRTLAEPVAEDAEQPRSGKILRFRAGAPLHAAAQGRNLPVVVEPSVNEKLIEALDCALDWVEAATRNLIKIWSGDDDQTPAFALNWQALERWLAALVRIANPPAERIEHAFRDVLRKLDDDAYAETPLAQIVQLIRGDEIAIKLLLVALAGDLDIRFHRMFGVLHDDLGRRYPSVGLTCAIIAAATADATPVTVRAHVAALRRLRRLGLVQGVGAAVAAADQPLRVEPQYVDWLLTADPDRLVGHDAARLVRATPESAAALLPERRLRRLRKAVRRSLVSQGHKGVAAVVLTGSAPGWIEVEATALAGLELRIGPAPDVAADALASAVRTLVVASRVTGSRLVVDLSSGGPQAEALWRAVTPALPHFERPPYVITGNAAELLAMAGDQGLVVASLPEPDLADRRDAIAAAIAEHDAFDIGLIETLAHRFPIALETIPEAVSMALSAAAAQGRPTRPEAQDWLAGFRRMAGSRLPRLARRLEPYPRPEDEQAACLDIVFLPQEQKDQLRSLIKHVRFSRTVLDDWGLGPLIDAKGVAALFTGESGTGKTMAAHAVASELATDLYAIDLAQIVSKYIGETEKNLDIIFDEAERAGAVLLFDEADALFGKRSAVSDAHDRYANIEVAYLLQRMQQFAGLAILTSNHPENIDPAFTRRLRFRVEFPKPSPADRLRIWDQSIPAAHREEGLDLTRIAFALDVTGGVIRQMALHAAVLAAEGNWAINFDHVLAGARSQLIRLGAYEDLPKLDMLARNAEQARAA